MVKSYMESEDCTPGKREGCSLRASVALRRSMLAESSWIALYASYPRLVRVLGSLSLRAVKHLFCSVVTSRAMSYTAFICLSAILQSSSSPRDSLITRSRCFPVLTFHNCQVYSLSLQVQDAWMIQCHFQLWTSRHIWPMTLLILLLPSNLLALQQYIKPVWISASSISPDLGYLVKTSTIS